MKCPRNKILVHFSRQRIDAIFFTTVQKEDGTTAQLTINVPAEEQDDRLATLYAEVGEVIAIGNGITNIQCGDIAILDYNLFHDVRKLISDDEAGRTYIVDPITKYHSEDKIAYGNQKNPRNTLVWRRGEVEELSQLLAIIRNGELIANDPFVFLNYLPEESGQQIGKLVFLETPEIIERQILAASQMSAEKYEIKNGDVVLLRALDTFTVKLNDKLITCCNDEDLLMAAV